jgi:hypothetical protein
MYRSIYAYRALCVAVGVFAAFSGKAYSASFTNPAAFAIPGPGSSNGSAIAVSGLGNSITSVSVELIGFSATNPSDVGLVLVGPTGAALVLQGAAGGSVGVTAFNLTYSDGATSIPNGPFTSGTFAPTQYASIGSFPSPGPGLAYDSPALFGTRTLTAEFAGTNPNGTWSLYAIDPVAGDSGGISHGWNLQVVAVGPISPPAPEPSSLILASLGIAGMAGYRLRRRQQENLKLAAK